MKVQNIAIGKITPYDKNPRRNQNAVEKVANSIKAFGFKVPVIVDRDMVIIAGHTRLLAAKSLGLETVPVHIAADLTPEQCKAYRIADNKTAEYAEWDMDLLAQEILDLQGVNFDLADLGFEDAELAKLLNDDFGPMVDEVAMPDLPSGDKNPFQTMTFTLHDDQIRVVSAALLNAKNRGPFFGTSNENINGNCLARVCELFLEAQHADR